MKRVALLCVAFLFALVGTANAQGLTMQMSNGWTFSFAGNVNAFLTYQNPSSGGGTNGFGSLVPDSNANSLTRIQTGLLPAFAVFDAKGKEGETDLGVHFGFAPQINNAAGVHDQFGAQIDMRQVFLTVGGSWGQILAGRELGLWGRQNILTDQTLFGVGGTGGNTGGGTTLGRIGFGYIYPNFKAQMTYSTPGGKPAQFSIGLFEAASNGAYSEIETPRVESELVYSQGEVKGWVGGLLQSTKTAAATSNSATAWGGSGGLRYGNETFSVTGSGYYGKGVGTTLLTSGGVCTIAGCGTRGSDDLRSSYGFIGQVTVTPKDSKVTLAGSYGSSYLKASNFEETVAATNFKTENTLVSGGIYYQATKSLKVVGEGNYSWSKLTRRPTNPPKNKSFVPALGLMLFF